ncbi:MAG TPA: hypothetical protein VLB44_19815 [Kofleriaceae bacterium]|nr:hypothetical protein [Kofleriaceae bacterium]
MRFAWVVGMLVPLAACGRLGFDRAQPCSIDPDCASDHCVAGLCCDRPCDGTCNSCETGTCLPLPSACSGDCVSCEASGDGFSCIAAPTACTTLCSSATCDGAGTAFSCNTSSCCSTATAPNLGGSCATGPTVLLGDGCHFSYDYSAYVMANNFINVEWDEEVCVGGTWMTFDAGVDAFPCSGCVHDTHNTWSDTCGNAAGFTQVCP